MSRPRRPITYYVSGTTLCYARSEADAYITAIEKERDEAVELLRRWEAGPMLEDRAALHQETALFLERIEGGDNG